MFIRNFFFTYLLRDKRSDLFRFTSQMHLSVSCSRQTTPWPRLDVTHHTQLRAGQDQFVEFDACYAGQDRLVECHASHAGQLGDHPMTLYNPQQHSLNYLDKVEKGYHLAAHAIDYSPPRTHVPSLTIIKFSDCRHGLPLRQDAQSSR
jgi:hypothetical protein